MLDIVVGDLRFKARLEEEISPRSVAAVRKLLPLEAHLLQARWSGQSAWVPLGELDAGVGPESPTSYPGPGELLLYPGGISETEILLAYGGVHFASKMGQLAGNHFLTITSGAEQLPELGRTVLWEGALDIVFDAA